LDPASFTVTKNGSEVTLLPKEFALLEFFMRNPDKVFSSDALLRRIWDTDSDSSNNALRSTMRRLRQKLGEDGDNDREYPWRRLSSPQQMIRKLCRYYTSEGKADEKNLDSRMGASGGD
jgi:hypothetical protein